MRPGRSRVRGAAVAISLAVLALASTAGPVVAECSAYQYPPPVADYVGHAFTATVTSVSRDPQTRSRSTPYDWETVLRVDRVLRGSVPDRVVVDGWANGCGWLLGYRLAPGDRVLISTGDLVLPTLHEPLVAWRRDRDRWRFDRRILIGTRPTIPAALTGATTMREILWLVAADDLPGTDASAPSDAVVPPWELLLLVGAGVVGATAFHGRVRRSR